MKINPSSTGSRQTSIPSPSDHSLFQADFFTSDVSPSLTPRENQIVGLLILRKTRKEIAEELDVSEWTIEFHLRNARRKKAVHSTADLLVFFCVWTCRKL